MFIVLVVLGVVLLVAIILVRVLLAGRSSTHERQPVTADAHGTADLRDPAAQRRPDGRAVPGSPKHRADDQRSGRSQP